jgi:hypothetical protein
MDLVPAKTPFPLFMNRSRNHGAIPNAVWICLALLLVVCAIVIAVAFIVRVPSDVALTHWFSEHRSKLEALVSLVESNSVICFIQRSDPKSTLIVTDKENRLISETEAPWIYRESRPLFDALNCDYVSKSDSEIIVGLHRNGIEDLYPGGFKVIAFRTNRPTFIVSSIDDERRRSPGKYDLYLPMAGSWYLKYEEAH